MSDANEMNAGGAGTTDKKLRIRSLEDVVEVLEGGDIRACAFLLDAISKSPKALLAYGKLDGRDIVDIVLDETNRPQGPGLWLQAVIALSAFDDPRVVDFMRRLFTESGDPSIMRLAAERLSHESLVPMRDTLAEMVLQDESLPRARLAARLLLGTQKLTAEEAVRITLLAEKGEWKGPPFAETAAIWLKELNGPLILEARQELEGQGEPALSALAGHWADLSEENRIWLLGWAGRENLPALDDLLEDALASEALPLARAAMGILAGRSGAKERFDAALERWRGHPDPAVRLAALQAAPERIDWRALLDAESDQRLRCECLKRIGSREGAAAIPTLLSYIESDEWQIRSAATSGLLAVGEPAREAARGLVTHPVEGVRVAAAQVLLGLDDDDWLEENVVKRKLQGA